MTLLAAPSPGPPLDPSGDEARRLLREELLHREYHRTDLWGRLLDWLGRLFRGGVDAASGSSSITALVTIAVALGLVLALTLLLTRVQRDHRVRRQRGGAVLPDDRPSAADLRRRAEEAHAAGHHADAVVDGYRALAARQIEHGRLADRPGATAHEIAGLLATAYPGQAARVAAAADVFDATRYGDRTATAAQAQAVLALDDDLGHRPVGAR